ncbi:MAG: OmpH family outer membrane protein [Bacteroidetes bacterium]|nr:OmpH family outer membrane protein [Fibrella sp.]
MKKNLVMAFAAALLAGGLGAQAQAPASAAPTAAVAGPVKLGYTNIDVILSQTPESKDIQNQLQIQKTQAENELKRLQKEFEDKLAAYEKGLPQMSEVIKADREKELQSLQGRTQEFSRSAEQQLQTKYGQLVNPVMQKIQKNIDAVAKENGFTYIFNLDAGAGTTPILLYAPEEGNITDMVLKKMGIAPLPPRTATPATGAPAQSGSGAAPKKN